MKQFNKNIQEKKILLKQNKSTHIKRLSISLACLILVCVIILFTFAKFETSSEEYTLINGKILDSSSGDLNLAVNLNGQSVNEFPENNGEYQLTSIQCKDSDGDVDVEYDESTWKITGLLLTKKTKCTYYFISKEEWTFDYVTDNNGIGTYQEFTAPKAGIYKFELWGAEGGSYNSTYHGGMGAYTQGRIGLSKNQKLYIVVGQKGPNAPLSSYNGGFNGGGGLHGNSSGARSPECLSGGGGATDIRTVEPTFTLSGVYHTYVSDGESLNSRIMVAAGAGGGASGCESGSAPGADAGGLTGYNASGYNSNNSYGGTQISGGNGYFNGSGNATQYINGIFGIGGSAGYYPWGGGGGGYYGGGSGGGYQGGGAGGSSYISGHTGCVAITSSSDQTPKSGCTTGTTDNNCSKHYSNFYFTSTKMVDGQGYEWTTTKATTSTGMPTHDGSSTMTGNTGNGYAKITYLGE